MSRRRSSSLASIEQHERWHSERLNMRMAEKHHLTLACENRPGIVAAVSSTLFEAGADISEAQQFDDAANKRFFMRVAFNLPSAGQGSNAELRERLGSVADLFGMRWRLRQGNSRQRALILVSRQSHCLVDLLYQAQIGVLPMEIVGVVSNHPREVLGVSVPDGIPYHHYSSGGLGNMPWAMAVCCWSGSPWQTAQFCL